jgi:uracil phosphoribosyltransferase
MSTKVELNTLMKLFTIFVKKNWIAIDGYDDVLNRFGELIDTLKQEEVELIIELTDKYHWMTYNEYHTSIRTLLKELYSKSLTTKKKLYIFPVIKLKDEKDIKSGHVVMKMIDSIKSSIDEFDNIDVILLTEFEDLEITKLNLIDEDFLILVDDYIGSGNTLNSTIQEINKNDSIKDNYAVFTVAIQQDAKILLEAQNIKLYHYICMPKGITGSYNSPELEEKLKIMNGLEGKIPKIRRYKSGYEKSEALITLMRTPNNTFPIFWKGINHKGIELKPPFPRH